MDRLGEPAGDRSILSDRWRLYLGTALLLVGGLVAVLGFVRVAVGVFATLGLDAIVARQAAIALGAVLLPALFAGSLLAIPAAREIRMAAGAGLTVAILSVALFLFTVPATAIAPTLDVPVSILALYTLGAAVAIWSPLGAAAGALVTDDAASRQAPHGSLGTSTRRRRSASMGPDRIPADGGRENDDLTFLLDDEDREDP